MVTAGLVGLAQVQADAQAVLNAAASQFGTEPAPYAQPAPSVQRAVPVAQPAGAYAPASGVPVQETGALGAPDPSKPLGRGDIVTFSIAQDREAPQIMRVTDTGELDFSTFPKIGRISVVGRTCAQVASELKRKLESDYYNSADVILGINQVNHQDSRGKIYITGNVLVPGAQDLPSNERTMVSTAIIRAGGFAKFADGHRVQVTRVDKDGKTVRFKVDVESIIKNGHRERDIEIQAGDYINVPQKFINV